mmetsp:Transcript_44260/g.73437  ORF Transcript_44260/g.73437 Transcript_44260/m.73437 type:complete len:407 (+) Transcript_44260:90-1310(+)
MGIPGWSTAVRTGIWSPRIRYGMRTLLARGLSSNQADSGTSLIPQTLLEMEHDPEFRHTAKKLREVGQRRLTVEERRRRRRALDVLGVPDFEPFLRQRGALTESLRRAAVDTLQLNVGLYCNQACTHCHVESSPKRTEAMGTELVNQVLRVLAASPSVRTVDITGGAPEMNPGFRQLVIGARALGKEVIDRCNLTVMLEPEMQWLGPFLVEHQVRVVASLPCYSQKNVDTQRGNQVFERSIAALRSLNDLGYGAEGSPLKLDLVYNPGGAFLPPSQESLKEAYTKELQEAFGIRFNDLYTITNMPIKRFADFLYKHNRLQEYMQLLIDSFNPATLDHLMCRSLVSVGHDGKLYDCDFNLALASSMCTPAGEEPRSIWKLQSLTQLENNPINTGNHCFGCTAGMGSS